MEVGGCVWGARQGDFGGSDDYAYRIITSQLRGESQ